MEEKKLGLKSVISVSVGLVIATSCLVSLGQGAGNDRRDVYFCYGDCLSV